jgi:hypothetical protein
MSGPEIACCSRVLYEWVCPLGNWLSVPRNCPEVSLWEAWFHCQRLPISPLLDNFRADDLGGTRNALAILSVYCDSSLTGVVAGDGPDTFQAFAVQGRK